MLRLAVQVRYRLGEWVDDEQSAAVLRRPGTAWLAFVAGLALVMVLQRPENLTDRQGGEAARARVDWQVRRACWITGLDDMGRAGSGPAGVAGPG